MVDVSHSRKFHPVRKYLENLKWDGQKRLDTWLIDYCGAVDDNQDYVKAVGRKTLCAAVARVFKPGIKFDHVLVLEGVQNIGKSGVCRILGGEWFADFKMNAAEKDTVQMMQGKWIVEMAELHAARQTDLDTLKAFLTRQVDEARFAYGRLPGQYPRQGIFIATYNPGPDGTYLKDDTGNRRWWPVRCNGVPLGSRYFNFAGLTVIRDQLFAEATARWKAGEALTMETVKLQDAATIAQSQRHAEHPWVDRIAAWLVERDRLPETSLSFLAPRDIFVMAMQGLDARYGRREQLEIARAMRELGWVPGFNRDKKTGRTIRGYRRVENSCAKVSTNKIDLDIFGDLV
jgi:predicted P-loop ATPase